jgi:hypothetical protein
LGAAIGAGEETWNTLERVSYVWLKNRWVAYPFQNNISALDKEDQVGGCVGVWCGVPPQTAPQGVDGWVGQAGQVLAGITPVFGLPTSPLFSARRSSA